MGKTYFYIRVVWARTSILIALVACLPLTSNGQIHNDEGAMKTLKILSWNISNFHHVPGQSYRAEIGTYRKSADLGLIKDVIQDYAADVVLIQEAASELALMAMLGEQYTVVSSDAIKQDIRKSWRGRKSIHPLILVSNRLSGAVIENISFRVDSSIDPEVISRPIQYVKLEIAGRGFGIINVHAQSACSDTLVSKRLNCLLMFAQFDLLDKAVNSHKNADVLVVAGDFNRELLNKRLQGWVSEKIPWAKQIVAAPDCRLRANLEPIDFLIKAPSASRSSVVVDPVDITALDYVETLSAISDHCPLGIIAKLDD